MINVPLEVIIEKITEKTNLSKQEIEAKIKSKLEQLSGLISKEGAAHIIANELGVNLAQTQGIISIKDLLAGMRDLEIAGKVIKKYELRTFDTGKRKGQLAKFLFADKTGTTIVVMWNDQAELINTFKEGDILKIAGATARSNNGKNELHLSESSTIETNPAGIKIETQETSSTYQSNYNKPVSKKISELNEQDSNVEIFATIVQVFDPKFFRVDSETGKRIKEEDSKDSSKETFNYVLNIFVDDGSDNVRTVLWKNQIINLLGQTDQEILKYKDHPEEFEKIKTDLLGMMVKFIGRVSKNELFGRLEFVANVVIKDVKPEDEIKKLDSSASEKKETVEASKPEQKKEVKKETPKKEESKKDDLDDDLLSLEDIEDLEEDL
ncbi:hypothetical protein COV13_02480 [Candidatus Woesearchaeota archaeon CG10_big_fil_rev_8_21_14_0_10_32_9]|nr:MAG: hypothetical protein COV13_02480 [Candidatus Woesearchaeota archaeon CG10_big_fil_rev_8_21_14_0_10_32_9]